MQSNLNKLFFIYVAKNEEWEKRQEEDWDYVSSMVKFFHWWTKRNFALNFNIDADILPVITGRLFESNVISLFIKRSSRQR